MILILYTISLLKPSTCLTVHGEVITKRQRHLGVAHYKLCSSLLESPFICIILGAKKFNNGGNPNGSDIHALTYVVTCMLVGNPNRKKMHIFGFVGIFEYIC